ncbi:EAL domain-containing protein [Vibrio fluvialis]|uniref:EAL domain-containing protein n=1 Tax=Vibrio fluvialis TaxID=676 RepID=UPI001C9BF244|nr:EAL domain-containing protein [Vibrio fluvialis]MBY8284841.1 EAL domain-containing protein [Vibrio fluvialis]MCE7646474.1 EAL domain-containing protein [Vibrio fluvialis]
MGEKSEHCERIVCQQCAAERALDFDFTMAFQPIIDCQAQRVFGYEALVRGLHNEPAPVVIAHVTEENRYLFDQQCRIKAISLAAKLGIDGILSINFLPNAVYQPERCIRTTLEAAKTYQFPTQNIMFEFTEGEQISDSRHIKHIIEYYQSLGFRTAIDDFGAGYSGLNLLADFQTNIVKLDMALIRSIDSDFARQAIVRHCLAMFAELNITPLAEGIETLAEYQWLKEAGISLMQGYLFAKPGFECLPAVNFIR